MMQILKKRVAAGVSHCFLNSGQSCNAPTRMLVSEKNYDLAVSIAKEVAEKTTVGDLKMKIQELDPFQIKHNMKRFEINPDWYR